MSVPFNRPDIGEEDIASVVEVLESGILTNGKKQYEFERAFGDFLGNHALNDALNNKFHCIAVNSCTAGLALSLHCLGINRGDEVITSVLTFTATVETICTVGATPVLVDIDPLTLNLDLNQVQDKINDSTKAIIPIHFAGLACDMYKLWEIARERNIKIIEDAAHAMGSFWDWQKIGTFDFATTVFSFYPGKPITTGEGGMIVTQNEKLARIARMQRMHGIAKNVDGASWDYKVAVQGFKCNLNEISSAIGITQLQKFWTMTERRRNIAQEYNSVFNRLEHSYAVSLPPKPLLDKWHSWHLYVLQLPIGLERSNVLKKLTELGISTSVHYAPISSHPYWQRTLNLLQANFPHATLYGNQAFSLPIYSKMTNSQVRHVTNSVLLALDTMI